MKAATRRTSIQWSLLCAALLLWHPGVAAADPHEQDAPAEDMRRTPSTLPPLRDHMSVATIYPALLMVEDSAGRKTGTTATAKFQDIPTSRLSTAFNQVRIPLPLGDTYTVTLTGVAGEPNTGLIVRVYRGGQQLPDQGRARIALQAGETCTFTVDAQGTLAPMNCPALGGQPVNITLNWQTLPLIVDGPAAFAGSAGEVGQSSVSVEKQRAGTVVVAVLDGPSDLTIIQGGVFYIGGVAGSYTGRIQASDPVTGVTDVWEFPITLTPATCSLQVTGPAGGTVSGDQGVELTWSGSALTGPRVRLLLLKGGVAQRIIATNILNTGSYKWTVPDDEPAGADYTIRVEDEQDGANCGDESLPFTIARSIIWVTPPPEGVRHQALGRFATAVSLNVRKSGGVERQNIDVWVTPAPDGRGTPVFGTSPVSVRWKLANFAGKITENTVRYGRPGLSEVVDTSPDAGSLNGVVYSHTFTALPDVPVDTAYRFVVRALDDGVEQLSPPADLMATAQAPPAAAVAMAPATAARAGDVRLTPDTVLRFATVDEGRAVLTQRDAYVRGLTPFDLMARLERTTPPTTEEFLAYWADGVLAWSEPEVERIGRIVREIAPRFAGLNVPLPPTLLLVKTSPRIESGAPHTRGNAIMLPDMTEAPDLYVAHVVAHEIFHVFSRYNASRLDDLYGLIGFRPCAAVALPPKFAARRISNPDALTLRHYIDITVAGAPAHAVLVIYATRPYSGGGFFEYLTIGLLLVESHGDGWRAVLRDGEPHVIPLQEAGGFIEQVGRNTGELFHPEEIIAASFAHLLVPVADLPTPDLVARLRAVLTE